MATEYVFHSAGLYRGTGIRRAGEPIPDSVIALHIRVGKREKLERIELSEAQALQTAAELIRAVQAMRDYRPAAGLHEGGR